jgi:hypothetical protein
MAIKVANGDLHNTPNPIITPVKTVLNALGLFSNFIKEKRDREIRNVNNGSVISGARQH